MHHPSPDRDVAERITRIVCALADAVARLILALHAAGRANRQGLPRSGRKLLRAGGLVAQLSLLDLIDNLPQFRRVLSGEIAMETSQR